MCVLETCSLRRRACSVDVTRNVLEADGVLPQREIVEQTDLSKATVSRTLDSLEAKSLLERKARGTGNVVLLR